MTTTAPAPESAAARLHVTGVVQGVGFRPYVHRLAMQHRLVGWVRNAAGEVEIEVEGTAAAIDEFVRDLPADAPPLAQVLGVRVETCHPGGRRAFAILPSTLAADRRQPVPADVALCAACAAELQDPTNRRYRYPFITCTDCGPRFSVIEAMPYDRERTTMRAFTQCAACAREYHTPGDRRYHSETNSCPDCGPRLWYAAAGVRVSGTEGALEAAATLIEAGGILALRGLGGFHLAVDAGNADAVERLRARKRRDAKPFAVMVRTVAQADDLAHMGRAERELLTARERPVVVLRRRDGTGLAAAIAPGLDSVGLLLAYTPVHLLLLERVGRPLVMTSGNASEEPIAIGIAEAEARLGAIADGFLLHDREIVARVDDSVVRATAAGGILLRRARGHAPLPLDLPVAAQAPLVAVGPHLKNTFTLVHGRSAYLSPHIGDLETLETLTHFEAMLARYRALFRIEPAVAVRDLHPGYLSTRVAESLGLERVVAVQHHHAHIAAVMAEHGVTQPVIGLAWDGTGYGDDGCVWGAELLECDLRSYRRLGQLRYAPLPGGNAAARAPWRAAMGFLSTMPSVAPAFRLAFGDVPATERVVAERQIAAGLNAPLASSMGRLFDAAAAVLGVRAVCRHEGQAAMELEALAGRRPAREYRCHISGSEEAGWQLDPVPLLVELGERRQSGEPVADLAADFHASIARAGAELVGRASDATGIRTAALGGGVFQNARLVASLRDRLVGLGLRVLLPVRLSPNDGAVSYGQAAVAAAGGGR